MTQLFDFYSHVNGPKAAFLYECPCRFSEFMEQNTFFLEHSLRDSVPKHAACNWAVNYAAQKYTIKAAK